MATGEQRPLLGAQQAIIDARRGAEERGEGVNRLLGTSGRLRDALKLQAELARAIKEKEKTKYKKSSISKWFKKKKKDRKMSPIKEDNGVSGSASIMETEPAEPIKADEEDITEETDTESSSDETTPGALAAAGSRQSINDPAQQEEIIQRLYENDLSTDQFVREAIQRDLDLDNLVESMFQRAETLQAQSEVAFEKTPTVQIREAERKNKLILIGVISSIVVIIVVVVTVSIEDDSDYGLYFVGRGGCPNSQGILQCDSALMDGKELRFGAVGAIEGVAAPIHVARYVMEDSPYSVLVGQGAQEFAVSHGVVIEPNEALIGKPAVQAYQDEQKRKHASHDTLGLIARDKEGNLAAGVSTSGIGLKHPGRVGDSTLPGCGLFVDNEAGAACCTGDGDDILRFCPSHAAVRLMAEGHHPKEACRRVISDIRKRVTGDMFYISMIAMDKQGKTGAATSIPDWVDLKNNDHYDGFPYAVWSEKHNPAETILTEKCVDEKN